MALHHAKSGEVVDLSPLAENLPSAQTAALVKTDSFEAVRLIVHAGTKIPRHHVGGKFTLHCLEGHVRLGLDSGEIDLSAGEWVYFDGGITHSMEGIENSSLLLTILFADPDGE